MTMKIVNMIVIVLLINNHDDKTWFCRIPYYVKSWGHNTTYYVTIVCYERVQRPRSRAPPSKEPRAGSMLVSPRTLVRQHGPLLENSPSRTGVAHGLGQVFSFHRLKKRLLNICQRRTHPQFKQRKQRQLRWRQRARPLKEKFEWTSNDDWLQEKVGLLIGLYWTRW